VMRRSGLEQQQQDVLLSRLQPHSRTPYVYPTWVYTNSLDPRDWLILLVTSLRSRPEYVTCAAMWQSRPLCCSTLARTGPLFWNLSAPESVLSSAWTMIHLVCRQNNTSLEGAGPILSPFPSLMIVSSHTASTHNTYTILTHWPCQNWCTNQVWTFCST
jgi:hypothetical protein